MGGFSDPSPYHAINIALYMIGVNYLLVDTTGIEPAHLRR